MTATDRPVATLAQPRYKPGLGKCDDCLQWFGYDQLFKPYGRPELTKVLLCAPCAIWRADKLHNVTAVAQPKLADGKGVPIDAQLSQ